MADSARHGRCPKCHQGEGYGWHIRHQLCEHCDWTDYERGSIAIAHKCTAWADVGCGKEHLPRPSSEWIRGWKAACAHFSTEFRVLTADVENNAAYRHITMKVKP